MHVTSTGKVHLLIGNKEVETSTYTEVRDPGRLTEVVGEVAEGKESHVDQAVQTAHAAFTDWRKTRLKDRSSLFFKAAALLRKEAEAIAPIVARESGMLLSIMEAEIAMAALTIEDAVEAAEEFLNSKQIEDGSSWVSVEKRPLGVIAGIVPWNAPILLTIQKLAQSLICGNTIVIKPSPNAPIGISVLLKKIAAIFPDGVINVVHGDVEVGSALTTHPLVRKISLTGGGAVAKAVMKSASESLKQVHFELGGNDPAIVLDDANWKEAMPDIVTGIFRRSGQFCIATKRVYVPETIYESFFEEMCRVIDAYKIGHPLDERATFGPLNNRNQYISVKEMAEKTTQSGAIVVELGQKLEEENWMNGYYIRPMVVRDVEEDHDIVACEQFGPIIPLLSYRTEEEVLKKVNDSEYGLGSSVWSSDFERAVTFSREIETGMTFINKNGPSRLGSRHAPFGGVKQSGIGRENSEIGLAEYIEYHSITYHK